MAAARAELDASCPKLEEAEANKAALAAVTTELEEPKAARAALDSVKTEAEEAKAALERRRRLPAPPWRTCYITAGSSTRTTTFPS